MGHFILGVDPLTHSFEGALFVGEEKKKKEKIGATLTIPEVANQMRKIQL